jgi:hypothetical protein
MLRFRLPLFLAAHGLRASRRSAGSAFQAAKHRARVQRKPEGSLKSMVENLWSDLRWEAERRGNGRGSLKTRNTVTPAWARILFDIQE